MKLRHEPFWLDRLSARRRPSFPRLRAHLDASVVIVGGGLTGAATAWSLAAARVPVVLLGTLQGILVAVIASLLALAQQAYDPPVHLVGRKRGTDVFRPRSNEHPDDESWPGLLILRVEGRALFLNAQRIGETAFVGILDVDAGVGVVHHRRVPAPREIRAQQHAGAEDPGGCDQERIARVAAQRGDARSHGRAR